MYLDVFTLSALVDEFLDVLVGGRVQDVLDVDATGLGLEIYSERRRRYLYLSADPQQPRLHLLNDKLRRGLNRPTTVGLLLRRYAEGGSITHVSQPPWERIVRIEVEGPEGPVDLVIEPMERRSNILLVQRGVILDCMKRVGPDENRYRLSLPQHEYKLPPPQTDKVDPSAVTVDLLYEWLAQTGDPKRKAQSLLTSAILGFSPLLAREVVFRATGDANQRAAQTDPDRLFDALQTVVGPLLRREWQPGVVYDGDLVTAFSVYPIRALAGWEAVDSLSAALTAFYGAPIGEEAYAAAKIPVREALQEGRTRLGAKLASLERAMTDESDRDGLRQSGELILAYQYTLTPGQTELRAAYEVDGSLLIIPLDPALTPLENAQTYFTRYDKAKRALEEVPQLIRETRAELSYLEQLGVDLEFAASWPEIDEVRQALQAGGHWRGPAVKKIAGSGLSAPLRLVTREGVVIWVGRNSRQNDLVTFGKGGGQDWWLHARGVPGAHVVVKSDGRGPSEVVLAAAASLAAYYSASRGDAKVAVDVTRCMYVKKIKGAAPGLVTYRNEATRLVAPHKEDSLDL